MAYFSNGTEGTGYIEKYCHACRNWRVNGTGVKGCPIIDLHHIYNYGQDEDETAKAVLTVLIPRSDSGSNKQCAMFLPKPSAPLFTKENK